MDGSEKTEEAMKNLVVFEISKELIATKNIGGLQRSMKTKQT